MELFSSLSAGIILGLSAGFAPGPLLTLVVSQTLKYNMREGLKIVVAPLITDLPIIIMSLFILTKLSDFKIILGIISCIGAVYIISLSIEHLKIKPSKINIEEDVPDSIKKGIIVNALSPHPYLFWITVGAPLTIRLYNNNFLSAIIFVSCFYLLLIGSKIFLALLVNRFRSFLTSQKYIYIIRIMGIALILFALLLLKEALSLFNFF